MAIISQHQQQPGSSPTTQHTLLIATTDEDQRGFPASQLDADGHTIHEADSTQATITKLSAHPIDVMILGHLQRPADAPALLRAIRAGAHPRIHPAQPIITIGIDDELTVLRAYESGSDHHLPDGTGYVLLRAVLASVARRALSNIRSRHLHVGEMHIDPAARTVEIDGTVVCLTRWNSSCWSPSPATRYGSSAKTNSHAASGDASRSADGPSKATSADYAAASQPPAPARCSSTAGATAGL